MQLSHLFIINRNLEFKSQSCFKPVELERTVGYPNGNIHETKIIIYDQYVYI